MDKKQILEDLKTFISMKSVSADPDAKDNLSLCQQFLKLVFESHGLSARLLPTSGVSGVFAETPFDPKKKTVLIYGHYDVQPAEMSDGWKTDPFVLVEDGHNLFGRGTTDDKSPVMALMHSTFILHESNSLPVNVKFIIEGEEEMGSLHFKELVHNHKDILHHDCVLISDGDWLAENKPSIIYGLRGIVYCYIRVDGPATDIHSGGHGGPVINPMMSVAHILASCQDQKTGKVLISKFYDKVNPISEKEIEAFKEIPFDAEKYKKDIGVKQLRSDENWKILAMRMAEPTFEVHGIRGGFTGEGAKTIIPAYAEAKVSMRLVPNQNPLEILELFKAHVHKVCPEAKVRSDAQASPFMMTLDSPVIKVAESALLHGFNLKPIFLREGGSIPALTALTEQYNKPIMFIPIGLPGDNPHAPNEKFPKEHIFKGIETFKYFLQHVHEVL